MLYEKEITKIFKPLISKYQLSTTLKGENTIQLIGSKSVIEISIFMGEVFVFLKKNSNDELGIEPMVWAYFTEQVNYKKLKPVPHSENIILNEKVLCRLREEYATIKLFCGKLLNGEFPDLNMFEKKKSQILMEVNQHFELKRKN